MDGTDGDRLKFEKIGQFFLSLNATSSKTPQEMYYG